MSSYLFNDPTKLWNITGNRLRSSNNTILKLDASGSSSNIILSKNDISLCTIGTNVDICSNSVLNSCAMTIGIFDYSANTNLNTYGAYYSFGESSTQIAYGGTSTRPPIGRPGYIRYNSDDYSVEFWSTLTNTWSRISEPIPTFTSISPNYVPEDSSFNYTVTGTNFLSGATVSFISVSGSIEYAAGGGTSFISNTQLQALNSLTMSNAGGGVTGAGSQGYKIKITNPGGSSVTTPGAVLTFNQGPLWITPAGTNLGYGASGQLYTYANSLFSDLSAVDTGSTIHNPLKYFIDPSGSTISGATSVILDPSGRLRGTMPSGFAGQTNSYPFNAYVFDASNAVSDTRNFTFTVVAANKNLVTTSVTGGGGVIDVSYITLNGTSYNATPDVSGWTLYQFKTGTNTTNATFTFSNTIDMSGEVLVVGGGGGSGYAQGGGGGGEVKQALVNLYAGTTYNITVGAGGAKSPSTSVPGVVATAGSSSTAFGHTAGGGGVSAVYVSPWPYGGTSGNGNIGGAGQTAYAGGGGGARGVGSGAGFSPSPSTGGAGGDGVASSITGSLVYYGGGGGGGANPGPGGAGGAGGGGTGGSGNAAPSPSLVLPIAGTQHRGGGAGGAANSQGVDGGAGIVILKIPSYNFIPNNYRNLRVSSGLTYYISYLSSGGTPIAGPVSGGSTLYNFTSGTGTIIPTFSGTINALIVAGGGGGGRGLAGGGGAGEYVSTSISATLNTSYTVIVGSGGTAAASDNTSGGDGNDSTFHTTTCNGGGGGGGYNLSGAPGVPGRTGGSSGGNSGWAGGGTSPSGTATAVTKTAGGSGNVGGLGGSFLTTDGGGGGGGAGGVGGNCYNEGGGSGGAGIADTFSGYTLYYAGGGGGNNGGFGGGITQGGGGLGGQGSESGSPGFVSAGNGAANTGSGGGGSYSPSAAGAGGSGIVILKFTSF